MTLTLFFSITNFVTVEKIKNLMVLPFLSLICVIWKFPVRTE